MQQLTPKEIVEELDRYIIGQTQAKRAVAIALRNRYRRKKLLSDIKEDLYPKNIILIGSTGVGKTEIARRLAKIVGAPFIKVEASKFTEVGYVGRDVESMIRELVETGVRLVKLEKMREVEDQALTLANRRIVDVLLPGKNRHNSRNKFNFWLQNNEITGKEEEDNTNNPVDEANLRQIIERKLERFELEDEVIEVELEEKNPALTAMFSGSGLEEIGVNMQDLLGGLLPKNRKKRSMTVEKARKVFQAEEAEQLVELETVTQEAIRRVEEDGIIFLDEIDKIAGKGSSHGPDVSREGVQRDILPIVEGSTVNTKYGPVKTDFILFIAAGAFHVSKPSDLIPELQGRFPIRVELENLDRAAMKRILTEPRHSLLKQYQALLTTEHLELEFDEETIDYITEVVCDVNEKTENIGARRLYTVLEKVLEDVMFDAPYLEAGRLTITKAYTEARLKKLVDNEDVSRYIL
jgi:ATP-dependent HslUV protease ATP-binding subunit HslU